MIDYIKNRLLLVLLKRMENVKRLIKGKGLDELCGKALWVFFLHVVWSRRKKRNILTAHTYRKCGIGVLRVINIKDLEVIGLMESAVRFEADKSLGGGQTHPPLKYWGLFMVVCHLFLAINSVIFGGVFSFFSVFSLSESGGTGGSDA